MLIFLALGLANFALGLPNNVALGVTPNNATNALGGNLFQFKLA